MKLFRFSLKFMLLVSIGMSLSLAGCNKQSNNVQSVNLEDAIQSQVVEHTTINAQSISQVAKSSNIADENLSNGEEQDEAIYFRDTFTSLNVKPEKTIEGYILKPIKIGSFFNYDDNTGNFDLDSNGKSYGFYNDFWGGCSEWCGVNLFDKATASSTLKKEGDFSYEADNVIYMTPSEDYNLREHVWCEGAKGDGVGQYIEITRTMIEPDEFEYGVLEDGSIDPETFYIKEDKPLEERTEFEYTSLCIVNGYAEDEKKWSENGRARILTMFVNDEFYGYIELEDTINPQYIPLFGIKAHSTEEMKFRFDIAEAYKGLKYDDTCITGIVFGFDGIGGHKATNK